MSKHMLKREKNITFTEINLIRRWGFKFYQIRKSRYLAISKYDIRKHTFPKYNMTRLGMELNEYSYDKIISG